jgi:Ca-activated chloride channel family protein
MTFQWGSLLWLLFLVPILVLIYLWAQRRRRKYAARYASIMLVKDALGKGPGFKRHIPAILFLAGITVGIVALARPQATVLLPSMHGTVILAIDTSGSMRAQDLKPSRFEAAKEAAKAFIDKQPRSVKIGIVAFAGSSALVQPPSTVREDLYAAIDRLRLQRATAVGSGILTALDAIFEDSPKAQQQQDEGGFGFGGRFGGFGSFGQSGAQNGRQGGGQGGGQPGGQPDPADQPLAHAQDPADQIPVAPGSYTSAAIVLLTDGQTNTGPDPLDAAQQAADKGVRVFTVGVGTTNGDTVGMEGRRFRVGLDEESLKKIAQNTAAAYFKADNEGDLLRIYRALSVRLTMGRTPTEVTALFAAAALGILLIGAILSLLWFNRTAL